MNNFAPVIIPTLNRYQHFKRCVESLSKCSHSDRTDLFIFLDYPLNETHWEGYNNIKKYIQIIHGFKSINLIERQKNYGALKNYQELLREMFEKYEKIIFTEDDNIFSPNFLEYMNNGLIKFEGNKKISAICAYNYPIIMPNDFITNYYRYRGFSAWGFATWRNRFEEVVYTKEMMIEFSRHSDFIVEMKKISERHLFNLATSILTNNEKYGDFTIFLNNIRKDQYCIFPILSKVKNYGNDGTGVHCGSLQEKLFTNQSIDELSTFEFIDSKFNEILEFNNLLKHYFKMTIKQKIFYPMIITILKCYLMIKPNRIEKQNNY